MGCGPCLLHERLTSAWLALPPPPEPAERLRLDLLRLHVFDREISDRQGNLVDNDHLRLLDYLIDQAKRRGIYLVLTPIAWWGVPGRSDGFSDAYPMPRMTTDPAVWAAEGRYLKQFLRHTNRYTGLAYAEERAIAALELINEPQTLQILRTPKLPSTSIP